MTLTQFFKELRSLRGKFYLQYGVLIRTKREHLTDTYGHQCLCPIEELYRSKTKKRYNGSLDCAEDGLGLTTRASVAIINAADGPRNKYRKPLLRALGL